MKRGMLNTENLSAKKIKRKWAAPQVYLVDDMIFEILSRVPQKTLSRFRGVCKSWLTEISTHPFLRQRLETTVIIHEPYHHITKLLVLALPASDSPTLISSPKSFPKFLDSTNHISIAASTNGLFFCILNYPFLDDKCYLCNPHTQECVVLPAPNRWNPIKFDAGLAFDPRNNRGDKATFKIVTIHDIDDKDRRKRYGFEIYSSKNPGAWCVSQEVCMAPEPNPYIFYLQTRGDCVVFYGSLLLWVEPTYNIIAFDTASETSRCVALPLPPANQLDAIEGTVIDGWLGENCGSPFFIIVTRPCWMSQLMVWKLADLSTGQWTPMLYTVDMGFLFSTYRDLAPSPDANRYRLYYPVGIEQEGNFILLSTDCGKTLLLDVKRNKLHLIVQGQLDWATEDGLFKPQFRYLFYHPTAKFLGARK